MWYPRHIERYVYVDCLSMTPHRVGFSGCVGLLLLFVFELCMSTHEGITHSSSQVIPLGKTGTIMLSVHVLGRPERAPKYSDLYCSQHYFGHGGSCIYSHVYILLVRILHLYISNALLYSLFAGASWSWTSPSCIGCLFHPQTWCMMDLAIDGMSWEIRRCLEWLRDHHCMDIGMAGHVDQEAVQHYCRVGLMWTWVSVRLTMIGDLRLWPINRSASGVVAWLASKPMLFCSVSVKCVDMLLR